jgi:hypothetical protein
VTNDSSTLSDFHSLKNGRKEILDSPKNSVSQVNQTFAVEFHHERNDLCGALFETSVHSFEVRGECRQSEASLDRNNSHRTSPVEFGQKKLEDRFEEFGVSMVAVVSLPLDDSDEDVHRNRNVKRLLSV